MAAVCIFVIVLKLLDGVGAEIANERSQSIFPDRYDKFEPPWKKGIPADVYISLVIMDVDSINDGKMEFSVQAYFCEIWKDDRLNLSSFNQEFGAISVLPTYVRSHIWEPDLVFDNTKDGKLFHLSLPNTFIEVRKDYSFKKMTRYNLIVGCAMDFHLYPVDVQECYLKIAILSNPASRVELHWMEEKMDEHYTSILLVYPIQPLNYILHNPVPHKTIEIWPNGNFSYLYANFTFTRRLSGSVFNVYLPSTLVVLLSWISFWVDIEAVPARVTLGVTSLLTLGTQIVQARSGLPALSYMTAMDIWMFACLLTVFGVLLEFAFAYQIFILSKQKTVMDEVQQAESSKTDVKILKSRLIQNLQTVNNCKTEKDSPSNTPINLTKGNSNNKYLDKICRKVIPLAFFLFALIYWIYYLNLK